MSKKTSYILGILITIIIGTLLYCYLCDTCHCFPTTGENVKEEPTNTDVAKPQVPEVKEVTRNAFAVSDSNSDFSINTNATNDNFNFKASSFLILQPVSTNVTDKVSDLKKYLLANPLKTLDVTGYYTSDETNGSAYPNLGIARANAVKNHLVTQGGLSLKQINIKGELNDAIIHDDDNTFYGPVSFGLSTMDSENKDDTALNAACENLRKNPLILYFKTGQTEINLTAAQREKIRNISRCIDKMGVKVQAFGHTDNQGNANANIGYGQKRADFAKDYLVRNGILSENIETISKGQTEPIADNTTEEGKAKNRRTVITIN